MSDIPEHRQFNNSPSPKMVEAMKLNREHQDAYEDFIYEAVPHSRERSIALTKLNEVRMWLNEAVTQNHG